MFTQDLTPHSDPDLPRRAIILTKAGRWWIYEYLFAKNDRENIEADELEQFRELAKTYAKLNDKKLSN